MARSRLFLGSPASSTPGSIAWVQEVISYGSSSSVSDHSVGFTVIPTANHVVLSINASGGRTLNSITDPRGNTWSIINGAIQSTTQRSNFAVAKVTTPYQSGDTLTLTMSAACALAVLGNEFSGLADSPIDVSATAIEESTPSADFATGSTATLAEAVELIVGVLGMQSTATVTVANPSGATSLGNVASTGTVRNVYSHWKLSSSTAGVSYDGTLSTERFNSAIVVALKAAPGGSIPVEGDFTADAIVRRTITPSSQLVYVSKVGTSGSGNDQFSTPPGIATDGTHVYIADSLNYRIVKRLASDLSYVSKIGTGGTGNDQFNEPSGIATDGTYVYVADTSNHRIVKRLASDLSYVAQVGSLGTGNDQFNDPYGIATDGTYVYVVDRDNQRVVKRLASDLSYVAQTGDEGFNVPRGVATDGAYVYVADTDNHRIVKLLASDLSFVAHVFSFGTGNNSFTWPYGIATDGTYVYVADTSNHRIVRRLASDLSYVAQVGSSGSGDDQFSFPQGVAVSGAYVYVADTSNHRIQKRLTFQPLTADAIVRRPDQPGSFTVNAVIKREAVGNLTADAVVEREQVGSFVADAVIFRTIGADFTIDARVSSVGRCVWTTPIDGIQISSTPTLAFLMPDAQRAMHFEIQIAADSGFTSPATYTSHRDLTGWEYWDGAAWQPIPQSGVPSSFVGNEARYTLQTPLANGTWYRRVRAGVL